MFREIEGNCWTSYGFGMLIGRYTMCAEPWGLPCCQQGWQDDEHAVYAVKGALVTEKGDMLEVRIYWANLYTVLGMSRPGFPPR